MPRRNRVTPFGEIVATPERGTFFGNRGVLHDPEGRIRRAWQVKRWLLCLLEFKGRRRSVMTPGNYTELFFLDEATGLAAGHRPCAECRRGRFLAFRDLWPSGRLSAPDLDDQLHAERLNPTARNAASRRTWTTSPTACSSPGVSRSRRPTCSGRAGCSPGRRAATRIGSPGRRGTSGRPDAQIDRRGHPGRLRPRSTPVRRRRVTRRRRLQSPPGRIVSWEKTTTQPPSRFTHVMERRRSRQFWTGVPSLSTILQS